MKPQPQIALIKTLCRNRFCPLGGRQAVGADEQTAGRRQADERRPNITREQICVAVNIWAAAVRRPWRRSCKQRSTGSTPAAATGERSEGTGFGFSRASGTNLSYVLCQRDAATIGIVFLLCITVRLVMLFVQQSAVVLTVSPKGLWDLSINTSTPPSDRLTHLTVLSLDAYW